MSNNPHDPWLYVLAFFAAIGMVAIFFMLLFFFLDLRAKARQKLLDKAFEEKRKKALRDAFASLDALVADSKRRQRGGHDDEKS